MMRPDQERVKNLLTDTVTLLCRNGLVFSEELRIEGLFGVTIDNKDAFFVHISEKFQGSNAEKECESHGTNAAEVLSMLAAKACSKELCEKNKSKLRQSIESDGSYHRNMNSASPNSPNRPPSHSSNQASPLHPERRPSITTSPAIKSEPADNYSAIDSKDKVLPVDNICKPTPRVPLPHGPDGPQFDGSEIPPDLQSIQGQFPFGDHNSNEPPLKRPNLDTAGRNGIDRFAQHNLQNDTHQSWPETQMPPNSVGSSWPPPGGAHLTAHNPPEMVTSTRGMDVELPTLQPGNFMDLLLRDPDVPQVDGQRFPVYQPQGGREVGGFQTANPPPSYPPPMSVPQHPQGIAPMQSPMKSGLPHSMQSPMKPMQPNFPIHSPIKPGLHQSAMGSPMQQQLSMNPMHQNNLPSMQQLANSVRHPNNSPLPPLSSSNMPPSTMSMPMAPNMPLMQQSSDSATLKQVNNLHSNNSPGGGQVPPLDMPLSHSPMHTQGSMDDSNSPLLHSDASLSPNLSSLQTISIHNPQDSEPALKKQKSGRSPKQMGRPPKQRTPRAKGDSPDGLERLFTCKVPGCGKTFTLDTNARRHERLAHKYFRGKTGMLEGEDMVKT